MPTVRTESGLGAEQGRERKNIITPLIRHAFFLDQPNISRVHAIMFSNTANIVESAANERKRKKNMQSSANSIS